MVAIALISYVNQPNPLESALALAVTLREESLHPHPETKRVAELLRQLLEAANVSAPALARHLEVAPQTVNRWKNAQAAPRPRQVQKIEQWLRDQLNEAEPVGHEVGTRGAAPDAVRHLGILFADEVLALETEARAVWVVKSGVLRESVRGTIGESVLQGLRRGTHFHYLFLEGTPAARSFEQLAEWLQGETFAGQVTGYELRDDRLARTIGLTEASGAWIGLQYSTTQAARLRRQFDVLFALGVREYADLGRTQVKNEDGQPCWLELATPQAARWLSTVEETAHNLEAARNQRNVKITRIPSKGA